jgi:uncharacterized membrane protein YecN with MAPEG domain
MQISIVPFYAVLLATLFIFLSARVIRTRRQEKVAIGDGNNPRLQRAIRVHANFSEYVPLALILVTFAEIQHFPPPVIHALCLMLITGRMSHAYGVSQQKEDFRFRVAGMALTFITIGISVLLLLGSSLMQLL